MNHDHRIQLLKLQITLDYVCVHTGVLQGWFLTNQLDVPKGFKPPMSYPNGLLSQKLCHYFNQGRTLKKIWRPHN